MRIRSSFVILLLVASAISSISTPPDNNSELDTFNQAFSKAILQTDHVGMLDMWADDGVDLMPSEAPLVGKAAIASWLKQIEATSPRSKVSKEELAFHDIRISGNWASEWATEHQIVQPHGKPQVEGYGKIALVLRRDAKRQWKIQQEMWNDSPQP